MTDTYHYQRQAEKIVEDHCKKIEDREKLYTQRRENFKHEQIMQALLRIESLIIDNKKPTKT